MRRGDSAPAWLATRLRRLAWPVVPLAAVWLPLPHLLLALGMPEQPVMTASRLAGQLLWFLAIYLVTVALTPSMLRLNMAYGWRVPVALAAGAVAVDILRFTSGLDVAGFPNIVLVWLAVHQLGFLYADGRLGRPWILASAGYGLATALVTFGPYPLSMIGMPGAPVSNMAPPTLALLSVGVGQIGLALALRRWIVSFAGWPGVSRALGWAGSRMTTLYLWHMSALFVIVSMVVVGLGVSTPEPGTSAWLSGWPHWLLMLILAMWPLLRGLARFETPRGQTVHRGDGQGRRGHRAGWAGSAHAHGDRLRPGDGSPARGGRDRGGPGAHRSVLSHLTRLTDEHSRTASGLGSPAPAARLTVPARSPHTPLDAKSF